MKAIFSRSNQDMGGIAVACLSDKARDFYISTDPINICGYCNDDGEIKYAINYSHSNYVKDFKLGLSFDDLQKELEDMADACN